MIDWLLAPIDAMRPHEVGFHLSWHARLMVAAWAVLVPAGILSARYLKVMPWQDWPHELDSRTWWNLHRGAQYCAGLLMAVGLWLILSMPVSVAAPSPSGTGSIALHQWAGWALVAIVGAQYLGGWLRGSKGGPTSPGPDGSLRGDHFDMTRRRRIFEHVHKFGGLFAAVFAVLVVLSGLWQANAPRWMWAGMLIWWAVLAAVVYRLERAGGVVDTYQAIWGPDPALPGNRTRPIGLRVRRRIR